ncbi:MAG: class IIb bacteriocin, lactobin A/cerein 7B family [Gammaproteobacteria bacterium]|nr:class IIb bacteriocin, lactobin A/cerein 7B family [Gammaproteobacteria bacterium]
MNIQEISQTLDTNSDFAAHAEQRMNELLARSATDASFRDLLLTEPRDAIKAFNGSDLPDGIEIHFIESDADVTLVLPDPSDLAAELSDDELEAVAGGILPFLAALGVVKCLQAGAIILASIAGTIAAADEFGAY